MRDRRFAAALLGFALVVAACSEGPGKGGELEGVEWILRSYAQDGALVLVPETEYADAEFDRSRVSGLSGCNQYDALYRAGGRTLLISQAASTLMACDEASMAFEATFLANLQASRFYSVHRETLTIFGAGRDTLLVFDAAPRNPLLGTWEVASFADAGGAVVAPVEGSSLEVVFGLASVGGNAGCNSFSGTYGTNGNVVRISRLATTLMACEEPLMIQEAAFLEALQGVAFLDRQGSTMLLTDRSGSLGVALVRPVVEEAPAPSAQPSVAPTPTPERTAESTAEPTAAPTATPTASPPPPTATPAPTAPPPIILPTVAQCDLLEADGSRLATIVYSATWFTLSQPPDLACRYFDPAQIAVPDDPASLVTAVMVSTTQTAYAESVAAATDAASWDVREQVELSIDGLSATMVEAEATTDASGLAPGTSRLAYIIDYGATGTITLFTTGQAGDESYAAHAAIATLMVDQSTFVAPS
jgi:heat shock protein HslJ